MKQSISRKIISITVVGVVASSVTILCINTIMMSGLLNRTIYDDMVAIQSMIARIQHQDETRLQQNAQMISTMPQLVDAVYTSDVQTIREIAEMFWRQFGLDAITVTDAKGIVMARGHLDAAGDDISHRAVMTQALKGNTLSGLIYEETAMVPYCIRTYTPIFKDGVQVGVLTLGLDIATEAYVDNIHDISGMHFILFTGDVSYMTSIKDRYGARATGAKLVCQHIADTVLKKGKTAVVQKEMLGSPNIAAYWPVKDVYGNITGMWAIVRSLAQCNMEKNRVIMVLMLCSLGIMLFFVLTAGLLSKKITMPIRKVTAYAVQVAGGDLNAPFDERYKGTDEVGLLIGALHKMVTTLKERIREAEAANKAKSSFLSTMSHEIRTPMNAILGITEIQLLNEALDPDVRNAMERIHNSGDLLLGIINDILDLSKIEAGKLELLVDKYEIASLISDTAQLNVMRIGSKPIAFELNADEMMPAYMLGDELRVKQILNNLLSNAFKYTKEGTVRMSISTEAIGGNANSEVVLIVTVGDTGQGMTDEQVKRLFDEYSRFNQATNRSTEGTGLGMSITNNLVSLMNGKILVRSEPGKGTTFTVRLPQVRIGSELLGREMAENLQRFRTHSRAQMRRVQISREPMPYGNVLIVDDVESNIFVARGLLAPYELRIDSADSGFAAIEKVKSGNVYDIIFMDHMMPQMDGIEATKILRDMGYDSPIVALTANAVAGQANIFLGNGFDDFLSKPIDIRQLNVMLNKLIRDKQPPEVIESARRQTEAKKSPDGGGRLMDDLAAALPTINPRFVEVFIRDARKSLAVLDEIAEKGGPSGNDELRTYTIHVHGIKGVLATIGKMDISAVAMKLEELGRQANIEAIIAETPAFLSSLRAFVDELAAEASSEADAAEDDVGLLREKLMVIKTACEEYDEVTAGSALKELKNKTWTPPVKEMLNMISGNLLHCNFDEIAEAVGDYLQPG